MGKKYAINFRETTSPITNLSTKFGGQPSWIDKSEWAISKSTGKPMMFICQIELEEEIFGKIESKMAYVFMTQDDEEFIDGTWEPNSGENAVIIQPNGNNARSESIEKGPSLTIWKNVEGEEIRKPLSAEFAIERSEIVFDRERGDDDDVENKVGGIPQFLQYEEFPDKDKYNWNLLLQLDSSSVPFEINFGDAGVGYAFISVDGRTGRFLWQCS